MTDEVNKRMATFLALLDLKEAVARDDVQAAREIREKDSFACLIHLVQMRVKRLNKFGILVEDGRATLRVPTRYWKRSNVRSRSLAIWKCC